VLESGYPPPQIIIFDPVHTATWSLRAVGAPVVLVGVHVSVVRSYTPPVFAEVGSHPPHTIIFDPVHTAVCWNRGDGAPVVLIPVHLSIAGS
jgi:hypothetical protein